MRAFCGRRVFSRGWGFSKTSYVCVGENLARRKLVREPNDGYPSDFALIPAFPSLGLSSMSADAEIPVTTLKALPQLKLLRLFHLASSEQSMRECALKHGMTQSSLTRGIHALEASLGERLFDKTRRGIQLTDAGHALREKTQKIFDDLSEARANLRNIKSNASGK